MAYLDDHPPARRQFYCPRRDGTQPSGVCVVHTAENTPDFVAFDGGAEAVAHWIQIRDTPGSYHDLADSDSTIQLVRYECEAFHDATGTNRHSYGVSGATRADVWPLAPQEWRDGCVRNMAAAARRYANWLKARRGIIIPARRITVTQARNKVPGFISHAELDPERRTDPGRDFPWSQFFDEFVGSTNPPEEDMTPEQDQLLRAVHAAVFAGQPGQLPRQVWATEVAHLPTQTGAAADLLRKIHVATSTAGDDVDEAAVAAAVLAVLTPEAIAAAIPGELATDVVDELHRRTAPPG